MSAPTSKIMIRIAYGMTQLPRVAWYLGHSLALRRLSQAARRIDGRKVRRRSHSDGPVPDRSRIYADMAKLFLQDLAKLLDLGCGTGRFLDFVKQAWPRLQILGLDMSEAYVRHAKRHLGRWSRLGLIVGKAETIPILDNSQDAVTGIFLFHELPPKVRRIVLRECARVLKPGGRLVLLDSLQRGDQPDYGGLLELFPHNYHEPYYASYITEDFGSLAGDCGMTSVRNINAFVSKVMVFDKLLRKTGQRSTLSTAMRAVVQ